MVETVNAANAIFAEAEATLDPGLPERIYAEAALAEVVDGIRTLRANGQRRLGSLLEIELVDLRVIDGARGRLRTRERWRSATLTAADGAVIETVDGWFEQVYEVQVRDGRWLVVGNEIVGARAPE